VAVFPVVLDSCVLYNAAVRDTLLRAAMAGLYRPHWNAQILDDTIRNLLADGRIRRPEDAARLRSNLESAFADAMVEVPDVQTAAMRNHEGDRHVAAAAVVAHAQVIVTLNLKHFPPEALEVYGIEAQSPDTFLSHLFDLEPALMRQILDEQAAALRHPPMSLSALMDRLAQDVPQFIERIRGSGVMRSLPGESP
jgi:hypothetical protein